MPKMSTREVQAILQAEKSDALGAIEASELSDQRSKAMEYYLGDESLDGDMTPAPDRSRAVSTDVADTIEGLMPSLMEIFASGDDVVEFEPVGIEDEDAAQQETDYINHVFWQKNHGFLTLYSFFKDALLQKNGIVKVWWEETEEEERESYTDLDDDAYAFLASDETVKIVEHEERVDEAVVAALLEQRPELGMEVPSDVLEMLPKRHDVTVAKTTKRGVARVAGVPPEEFGISRRARSIHISESDYCYHQVKRSQADLISEGYERQQIEDLPSAGPTDTEEDTTRDTVEDSDDIAQASLNKATRLILITEHYIKLDYEDNGKPQFYKITTASDSNEILRRRGTKEDKAEEIEDETDEIEAEEDEKPSKSGKPDIEPVDFIPFAALTPVIMTHRFFGRSVADLVMDIQRIKTALTRNLLDNIYLANNQRIEIAESHMHARTLDDLLTNRPGGIVRTKTPGGLQVLQNQSLGPFVYPMLEYMDTVREWRTGVTKQGQGLDAKSLADQSATAAAQMFTMAQARMRLIARIFAETGVRDLFRLLHATIRKHGSQEETVRLRNKWVPVDPRNWKTRNDMTINVGVASGSKEQRMAILLQLLGIQREAIQAPQLGLVKPKNIYNSLERVVQLADLKSIEPYFTDPEELDEGGNPVNAQEPPPDPKQQEVEQKMQLEQAKFQSQQQTDQAKLQMDREKAQFDMQMEDRKLQMQHEQRMREIEAGIEAKREQMQAEIQLKREQLSAELELKREHMSADLQIKRELGIAHEAVGAATRSVELGGEAG